MKKIEFVFCFLIGVSELVIAQNNNTLITPDGTTSPHKSLISTTDVVTVPSPAVSQLVYNTNAVITGVGADGAGYYFWNGTNWKKLAVGPVSGGAGSLPTTGIVLSETETNSPLSNVGFSFIGKFTTNYQAKIPNNGYSVEWFKTMNNVGAPSPRFGYATCMLSKMFIWGGFYRANTQSQGFTLNTGTLYETFDQWTQISTINSTARRYPSCVCSGSKAYIWGGLDDTGFLNSGQIYDETTNTWSIMSATNAPSARTGQTAVWTGTEMIVWGGSVSGSVTNTGGKYNPNSNSWTGVSTTNAPSGRSGHIAVWAGSKMIIWGGNGNTSNYFNNGAMYDPATDTWTAISTTNAPSARSGASAVWTGNKLIVLGGYGPSALSGGAMYDPTLDTWTSISNGSTNLGLIRLAFLNDNAYGVNPKLLVVGSENPTKTEIFDVNTNSWSTIPNTSNFPQYIESLVTNGLNAFAWGGYKYDQFSGNYIYYPNGYILGYTSFQSPTQNSFYLYKKN